MHVPQENLARVCLSRGERARVLWNEREYEAIVSGAVLSGESGPPVTGDWAAVRPIEPGLLLIEALLPRRSKIARRAAGRRTQEQVLAANVDLALIVCGLDGDFNARRLERYLAIAHEGGVQPAVILNKADLCPDPAATLARAREAARSAPILTLSARTGAGCEALQALLQPAVTAVLLGSSGAGKSSLLNRLLGQEAHVTAAVRESDARGRHTTTEREMILLPSGAALIDTPGLREIQLLVSEESVEAVFDEIASLASACQFRDCTHTSEPGCAVREAVSPERLASFHKLTREAGQVREKQRWRAIHKEMRRFYKERRR